MKAIVQRPEKSGSHLKYCNDLYDLELGAVQGDHAAFSRVKSMKLLARKYSSAEKNFPIVHKGYVDAHLHAMWMAQEESQIDLSAVASKEDLVKILNKAVRECPKGAYVSAGGWTEESLGVKQDELLRYFRAHIKNDVPVLVWRKCFHAALVNEALQASGASSALVYDEALFALYADLSQKNSARVCDSFVALQKRFLSLGFRALCDMSLSAEKIQNYLALQDSGRLKLDIRGVAQYKGGVEQKKIFKQKEHLLCVEHLKLFLDGSFGAQSAWLSSPYLGAKGCGTQMFSDEALLEISKKIIERKFSLSFHCIGDAALDQVLRLGRRLKLSKEQQHAHRLEHVQLCREDQLSELLAQGWQLFLQPIHRIDDESFIHKRLSGQQLAQEAYRLQSYRRGGAPIALSSDAPISSFNAEENIQKILKAYPKNETLSFEDLVWFSSTGSYQLLFSRFDPVQVGDLVFVSRRAC